MATTRATDEIEMIMMINFIRSWYVATKLSSKIDQEAINSLKIELERGSHKQDLYMKPVLENDALLHSIHVLSGQLITDEDENNNDHNIQPQESEESTSKLKEILASYKATLSTIMSDTNTNNEPTMIANTNRDYFQSYSNVYIHETMLRDEPRMNAYSAALNSEYLRGKTVLDVGCGSGILCMLAARGTTTTSTTTVTLPNLTLILSYIISGCNKGDWN